MAGIPSEPKENTKTHETDGNSKPSTPKKELSRSSPEGKKYPYLCKDLARPKPHQVWATDITSIRMNKGFLYLVAIIDW